MKGRRFPSVAILVAMGTASTVAPKETDKAADLPIPLPRACEQFAGGGRPGRAMGGRQSLSSRNSVNPSEASTYGAVISFRPAMDIVGVWRMNAHCA